MKLRLLDILVCPRDKHWPLELYPFQEKDIEEPKVPQRNKDSSLVCRFFCAKNKVKLDEDSEQRKNITYEKDCMNCFSKEIAEGMLKCTKCNSMYPIIEEIALMVTEELRNADIEKEFTEKWAEKIKELFSSE